MIPRSSTSIEISWREVPKMEQNGNVTHYEILYTAVTTTEGADLPQQQPAMATTEGPVRITLLRGLEEYTTYIISVRAVTIVGSGPPSPPEETQTLEDGEQMFLLLISQRKFTIATSVTLSCVACLVTNKDIVLICP